LLARKRRALTATRAPAKKKPPFAKISGLQREAYPKWGVFLHQGRERRASAKGVAESLTLKRGVLPQSPR